MLEELQEFYDYEVDRYRKILPTDKLHVEEYLFKFETTFAHFASLAWSKDTSKKTNSFLIYLAGVALENIVYATIASSITINDLMGEVNDLLESLEKIKVDDVDSLLIATIVPGSEKVASTVRLAAMIKTTEILTNTNLDSIIEHFKTSQKD